jgi:translation initiation factor IF-2
LVNQSKIRLLRDGAIAYEGKMSSLKRLKDEVKEVKTGYECGVAIENYTDIKVGDIIEAYEIVEDK